MIPVNVEVSFCFSQALSEHFKEAVLAQSRDRSLCFNYLSLYCQESSISLSLRGSVLLFFCVITSLFLSSQTAPLSPSLVSVKQTNKQTNTRSSDVTLSFVRQDARLTLLANTRRQHPSICLCIATQTTCWITAC